MSRLYFKEIYFSIFINKIKYLSQVRDLLVLVGMHNHNGLKLAFVDSCSLLDRGLGFRSQLIELLLDLGQLFSKQLVEFLLLHEFGLYELGLLMCAGL